MSVYRKRGIVVRWENGELIRVIEHGVAIEGEELFECRPDERQIRDAPDLSEAIESVRQGVASIQAAVPKTVTVERLLLLEGTAEHEYGNRRWSDSTRRLHLAMTRGSLRVLVDLGDFDQEEVRRAAEALARADASEAETPPRLRLVPGVSAAFLPSLVGLAPPNVRLVQSPGGVDGKGMEIVEASDSWPNWYRPSYRVRPLPRPLNLRLHCSVKEIDADRPVAVALLAPVDGLVARVLVEDGSSVRPATVRLTRIDAVGPGVRWYPYGCGSFGAEMML